MSKMHLMSVLAILALFFGASKIRSVTAQLAPGPNLAGEWLLDGNATDTSGYGNHGFLVSSPSYVTGHNGTGQALQFDGINDAVRSDYHPVNLEAGIQSWSVSAWVRVESKSGTEPHNIAGRYECGYTCGLPPGTTGPGSSWWALQISDTGLAGFVLRDEADNVTSATGTSNLLNDGQFHCVVGVLDRGNSRISVYVDGYQESSNDASTLGALADYGSPFSIGYHYREIWAAPIQYFKGTIDDVRVHNTALTESEVQTLCELVPPNTAPTADAGGPYSGNEGSAISLSGATASDPDLDALTYSWTVDSAVCSFNDASALNPDLTCSDNGTYTATLEVSDGTASVSSDAAVTVDNVAPALGAISVDQALVPVNTPVNASASFTDPGTLDTHTAAWDWGDGTSTGTVTQGAGSGSVNDSHSFSTPGVYTLKLSVTDSDAGVSNESVYQYVVVYDPDGGFVTGGGWIMSPAGAYAADPGLTGKANFGFVAKYKKGAHVPDGNTQFQFKAGDLNFHSTSYEWLVVAGNKAQFKGEGTINGQGSYRFMLWADDDDPDTFRIKIWDDTGVVYDNGSHQPLGGGSIKVHK